MRWLRAALAAAAALALPIHAQVPVKVYAQELVDEALARNPGLLVMVMQAAPSKGKEPVIIASNIGRIGRGAGEADPRDPAGDRFDVEVPLNDAAGDRIGSLGLAFSYRKGDEGALQARAIAIRDATARRILSGPNLMDPYPYEPGATTRTHAQKIVDEVQAADPAVIVLALRAPARGSKDMVVLGSTFGRHGKKADADDLKILTARDPATGVYSNGKRFGVDLALQDAAGRTIGTMNVGYPYRAGDDAQALVKKAEKLRDELKQRIPDVDRLDRLDP